MINNALYIEKSTGASSEERRTTDIFGSIECTAMVEIFLISSVTDVPGVKLVALGIVLERERQNMTERKRDTRRIKRVGR